MGGRNNMKQSVPVRLRVEKDVVIRVIRALKGRGDLQVSVGQQVTPPDIIGSGTISAGFRILNLSTLLSVPPHDVEKLLVRKVGQKIYKDELLAYKKGWLLGGKKVVTAPTDSILDFLNNKTGELKLSFLPKKADLPAGVYGIVEAVDNERGQVIIRTLASRIYGIIGSGRYRDGILHILGKRSDIISRNAMQAKWDGGILVGGSLLFRETISSAISAGVNGIITGGINARDYRGMAGGRLIFPKKLDNDIGISIVVCEGFGSVPIGDDIFRLLSEYEGKFVFIDGNKALVSLPSPLSSSLIKVKNTSLPSLKKVDLVPEDQDCINRLTELSTGCRVRVIGNSYLGEQGKVLAINDSLALLPSGIHSFIATVETTRRKIQVPVANLEVIV